MDRDRSIYNSFYNKKSNVYCAPRRDKVIDKEIDFPDIDFLSVPVNDISNNTLTYDHIQDVDDLDRSDEQQYKKGWIYGSIHPETNKVVWIDKSNTETHDDDLFDFTAFDQWVERFEKECDEFIDEHGYDEYLYHYCISNYDTDDDDENDDCSDQYDDNDECSDEEF